MKIMKSQFTALAFYLLAFLFISAPFEAKSDHKTYVKIVSGSPVSTVSTDWGKNNILLRSNEDAGYILVSALHKDTTSPSTRDYWAIRVIKVGDNGDLGWLFDYTLYESDDNDADALCAAPFAICPNIDGSGYVIAGSWQPASNTSLIHYGSQGSFYLEISNSGAVIRIRRHVITPGYVPLSICVGETGESYEDGQYVSVGVMSGDYKCISCSDKVGRIVRLDYDFDEIDAKTMNANFTVNPSSTEKGSDSRFDALCKIRKIPNIEEEAYIISGAITGAFSADESSYNLYEYAGISQGYIARIDDNLDVVWDKTYARYTDATPEYNHHQFSCPDFAFDPDDEDVVHGVMNLIYEPTGNPYGGIYFKLNLNNGNQIEANMLHGHSNFKSGFYTNIFVTSDSIFMCGLAEAESGAGYNNGTLQPFAFKFGKSTPHTQGGSFFLQADNYGYDVGFADCYLGIVYGSTNTTYEDLVQAYILTDLTTGTTDKVIGRYAPIIYCPSAWTYDDEYGLACHVPHKANSLCFSTSFVFAQNPQFFPSLFFNIYSTDCYYEDEEPTFETEIDLLTPDVTYLSDNAIEAMTEGVRIIENTPVYGTNNCGQPEPCAAPFLNTTQIPRTDLEGIKGYDFVEIYDIRGVLIYSGITLKSFYDNTSEISSGIYFIKYLKGQRVTGTKKIFINH